MPVLRGMGGEAHVTTSMGFPMLGEVFNTDARRMIAVFAVLLISFSVLAAVSPSAEAEEEEEEEIQEIHLGGNISSVLSYTEKQRLIIDRDLAIVNGGKITTEGDLIVNSGVSVTIEGGNAIQSSQLIIHGDATINGTITSKTGIKDGIGQVGLIIEPKDYHNLITINGSVYAVGDTSGTSVESMKITSTAVDTYDSLCSRVLVKGNLIVSTNTIAAVENVIIAKEAKFSNSGAILGSITLHGQAYFDGSVRSDSNHTSFLISIADPSAVITVYELSGDKPIEITDRLMMVYTHGGLDYYVEDYPHNVSAMSKIAISYDSDNHVFSPTVANMVKISAVKNLKVSETLFTGMAYDKGTSKDRMYAETGLWVGALDDKTVSKSDNTSMSKASITVEKGSWTHFETMTVSDTRIIIDSGTEAMVSGDIIANSSVSGEEGTVTVKGKLTVDGSLMMSPAGISMIDDGHVVAAHYISKTVDNVVTQYYTTLPKAIGNGAKTISILGTLTVGSDLSVPSGVKITTDGNEAYFDSIFNKKCAIIVRDDVEFKICRGASLTFKGNIAVQGTFIIEDMNSSAIKYGEYKAYADIVIKNDVYLEYTNLVSALGNAKVGDNLSLYNPVSDEGSIIDKDVTIPEGVTLTVPQNTAEITYKITVINGCELRIYGILDILAGGVLQQLADSEGTPGNGWSDVISAPKEGKLLDYSAIMIGENGILRSFSKMEYEVMSGSEIDVDASYRVAGAYYKDGRNLYCITNIPFAFSQIIDAADMTIGIHGKTSISNQSVSGTDKQGATIVFKSGSDTTFNRFVFSNGKVIVEAGSKIIGDIGTARGSIDFGETEVPSGVNDAAFREISLDGSMNLAVSGTFVSEYDATVKGTVYVSGESDSESFLFRGVTDAEGDVPDFMIPSGTEMYISGNVSLTTENSEFIVRGVLTAYNYGHLSSSVLSVIGTLDVSNKDSKPATASISNLLVGASTDAFKEFIPASAEGTAVVIGAGIFDFPDALYLFSGASIESAEVLADWIKYLALSTEFYVNDALWMTVYVQTTGTVKIATANGEDKDYEVVYHLIPVSQDRLFKSWQIFDSMSKTYSDVRPVFSATVGESKYAKVYTSLKSDIYTIQVVADAGVSDVYIDGVLMTKTVENNTFTRDVAAGEHTLTYKLAAGYGGEACIKAIDGKMIVGSGLTFKVNDDVYDADMDKMVVQLTGITKTGQDDPQPAVELDTTSLLLIVLIGIVAIILIVLFVRLRSR